MNNHDIPEAFLAGRYPYGSNGRNNFRFKGPVLYSYDDVIAVKSDGKLMVNSDTFTATSSRHQSAIKRAAPDHIPVPDLTSLLEIMRKRDAKDCSRYILRRRMAISEIERRIEASKSHDMIEVLKRRIDQERNAIKLAARYLPFDQAMRVFSGRAA
jgi:hypothetical protein